MKFPKPLAAAALALSCNPVESVEFPKQEYKITEAEMNNRRMNAGGILKSVS